MTYLRHTPWFQMCGARGVSILSTRAQEGTDVEGSRKEGQGQPGRRGGTHTPWSRACAATGGVEMRRAQHRKQQRQARSQSSPPPHIAPGTDIRHLENKPRTHPVHRLQIQAQLTLQRMKLGQRDGPDVAAAPQPRQCGHASAFQLLLQLPKLGLHLLLLLQCQLPGTVGRQCTLLRLLGLPLPRVTGLKPRRLQRLQRLAGWGGGGAVLQAQESP